MSSSLFLLLPLALGLAAVQAAWIGRISLWGGRADLVLVGLLLLATQTGRARASLLALIVAPFADSAAGLPLGASILPLLAAIYLTGLGERVLFGFRLGWPILVTLIATLLAGTITLAQLQLLGWPVAWGDRLLHSLLPSALLNGMLMLALFLLLNLLGRRRLRDFTT